MNEHEHGSHDGLVDDRPFKFALRLRNREAAALAGDLDLVRSRERGISVEGAKLLRALQGWLADRHDGDWLSEIGTGFDSSLLDADDKKPLLDEWTYYVENAGPGRFGVPRNGSGLSVLLAYILGSLQRRIGELEELRDKR